MPMQDGARIAAFAIFPLRHQLPRAKHLEAPKPATETPPRGSTRRRRPPCDTKRAENPPSHPRFRVTQNPIADFGLTRLFRALAAALPAIGVNVITFITYRRHKGLP
jgi:hypothetical protein